MIVDPDFLDHWRTGMVVDALGDPMAPMYILRLWSHCQERKADTFVMPTRGLKSQCKFPGDAEAFEAALIEAGFIERNGDSIYVCGWSEKNSSLLAAWANGQKGGRPKKETQPKPTGNPAVTQGKPSANPDQTQAKPIREEKSREEESPSLRSGARATRKCPEGFAITEDLVAWASTEAPLVNLDRETAKFRDHTFKTAHTDWAGAWRNWIRRAAESVPARAPPTGETAYQRNRREFMQNAVPSIAARTPGDFSNVIEMEPPNVIAGALGR